MTISDDFESVAEFRARVRAVVEQAVALKARRLVLVDPDFVEWPLDQAAVLEGLTRFAQLPDRRVLLIGNRFDGVQRTHPRFVAWRRTYAHAAQPLAPAEEGVELPTMMQIDRNVGLRVLERLRWRGRMVEQGPDAQRLAEEIDALTQRCEPTFAATTLGL